jgi:hypothetical protein
MRQCNRSDLNRHHQICARTAAGQRGERREQRAATRPSADCLRSGAEGGAGEERTHLGPRSAARRAPGAASAAGRSSRAMPGALALPLCSLAAVCRAKPLSGGVFLPPHGIFVLSRDDLARPQLYASQALAHCVRGGGPGSVSGVGPPSGERSRWPSPRHVDRQALHWRESTVPLSAAEQLRRLRVGTT